MIELNLNHNLRHSPLDSATPAAEFRATVLELCADIYTRIADLVETTPASALQQCFDGSDHSPLTVINATTELCDMLCNMEPGPDMELVGTPSGPEYEHSEPPDSDRLGDPAQSESAIGFEESYGEENKPEAIESHMHVSSDVDWSVEIDAHRHAESAVDPAAFSNDSDTSMMKEADLPPPACPPGWTKQEIDNVMKLFAQTPGSRASRRWFQIIAVSLQKKTSDQVSEFYHYCSANGLL
ncbi:hypothetical protein B0H14DRAFT_2994043 [Mycena olivaceomarginata]|nr:hypothetical protein B0H14DRAFT_2994043 [Mycena olivaceomarginata]